MKCNETLSKWCKNKHGASKIIDTLETYHLSARRYHSPPKSAIASRTPTRLPPRRLAAPFPDDAPFFHQNRRSSTSYCPARQLFEVVRRIAGLSRGATHLDLAQEVFSVLPRPWTSSLMTHKYRGSQQSSREVKPKFIDSTQGEPKNIYKP
jgi:hypothetical protein